MVSIHSCITYLVDIGNMLATVEAPTVASSGFTKLCHVPLVGVCLLSGSVWPQGLTALWHLHTLAHNRHNMYMQILIYVYVCMYVCTNICLHVDGIT